ncbi:hypothetical protein KGA66_27210 [Actinocrinis puniceicyclus]|uniref:Uncharacterized protein n=1 Tax=Actinocrinis puniceicyclus TaxID=977794 RepID=A0A8J7WU35_9ACTN|nr:hypothetical protein [Actinocrinis puniceicyclus]MBS2966755.1 hypothetical protein [Actinocrinis puniceicyclus]
MTSTPVAVLGFQCARPGAGAELTRLNVELGMALSIPDLMRYQVLVREGDDCALCVYWLWRDIAHRDAVWADPPAALSGFWAAARPLWRADPDVRRFQWKPAQDRDLCPAGSGVVLDAAAEADGEQLISIDGGAALSCRAAAGRFNPRRWTAVWQKPSNQERHGQ